MTKQVSMALLGVALFLTACSKKMQFAVSPVVPSASGAVKVSTDNNNNYSVSLKVKHLANPENLTPPRKEYIVWMLTGDNQTRNLGRLKVSGSLSGSLETVTTFKPVSFFVTAEDDATTITPGTSVILKTE